MKMDLATQLDAAVRAVCPIWGVSIGKVNDRSTWSFTPTPDATEEQIGEAALVIVNFVPKPDPPTLEERVAALEAEIKTKEDKK